MPLRVDDGPCDLLISGWPLQQFYSSALLKLVDYFIHLRVWDVFELFTPTPPRIGCWRDRTSEASACLFVSFPASLPSSDFCTFPFLDEFQPVSTRST